MDILPCQTDDSKHNLTSRAGLAVIAELIKRLRLTEAADRLLPAARSNRACRQSTLFNTFMLMKHEGGQCLEDVRHLKGEAGLMRRLGLDPLPDARTFGNWLRRLGQCRQAQPALADINRTLMSAALHRCRTVTLDIDATVIASKKSAAKWNCKGSRGYTPMVGHIAETGQVVETEFRAGNAPPNKDSLGFIRRCEAALPAGVSVARLRVDAAGCQAEVINHARDRGIGFVIRAKMDTALKNSISAIRESDCKPLRQRCGELSETEQAARTVHVMGDTPEAFALVVQRQRIGEEDPDPQADLFADLFADEDGQSVRKGKYIYRALATNLDLKGGLSDHEIVQFCNQRADASENRIKELRSDFAAALPPCGDFDANAACLKLCAIAYSLLALLREILPLKWQGRRAPTIRLRLYALAGQIVCHARQRTLKLNHRHRRLLDEALWSVRQCQLS